MIGYMLLGAWVLTLIILGFFVIDDSSYFGLWFGKILYLTALAWTFYEMGAHFSDL